MSQEQADRAIEQLYADASARDELTDDEAKVLLKWGEEQIHKLAAQNLDDTQFDEAFAHLGKLLTRVNRFTARRVDQVPEEQQESVSRIAASAQALAGYIPSAQAVAPPSFDTYLQQQTGLDNIANIQALTALIAPETTASAEAAPSAEPNASAEAAPSAEPTSTTENSQTLATSGTTAITLFEPPATPPIPSQPSTTGDHNGETQQ